MRAITVEPGGQSSVQLSELPDPPSSEGDLIFGTVNANLDHYAAAHEALRRADPDWLGGPINRRVPLARWLEAFEKRPGDIKVVLDFEAEA